MKQLTIDVGGTFTDCLVMEESGELRKFKASSTPDDLARGLFDALDKAAGAHGEDLEQFLADVELIVHGTTLGINILLTGQGAQVGLITTKGFRDVIEIRRGIKNLHGSMFDQFIEPYRPLVPRRRRLGVSERTLYTGEIIEPLDEAGVRDAAKRLVDDGCEAIAIGFLHSYANSTNELRAKEIVSEIDGIYVTASHEIIPTWQEFERFSSTVVSAHIGPALTKYLTALEARLKERGFGGTLLLMLANGLVQVVDQCLDRAIYLLGSGPAAAPSAAVRIGTQHGHRDLLSFDMGGTSLDVSVVRDAEVPTTNEAWVGEERVAIKMVDVVSIGAGGGSIAWIDQLGLLRVGPMSAGADPGPAAYGQGNEPTVTDADLVLGYVPADYFLGGEIELDLDRARKALEPVGVAIGLSVDETARAIFETVNSIIADQITEVCTKQGYDVRDFALVAGGGAGGIHAAAIAERLSIPEVIVPGSSALMSAFGMFTMDLGQQYARTRFRDLDRIDPGEVEQIYDEMRSEAEAAFAEIAVGEGALEFYQTVDMRYTGQFHEVEIELPSEPVSQDSLDELVRRFNEQYEKLYGYSLPEQPVEFLTFYLKVTRPRRRFELLGTSAKPGDIEQARRGTRSCLLADERVNVRVYDGDRLQPGHRILGPALIDDTTTTVFVGAGSTCQIDPHGHLVISSSLQQVATAAA